MTILTVEFRCSDENKKDELVELLTAVNTKDIEQEGVRVKILKDQNLLEYQPVV